MATYRTGGCTVVELRGEVDIAAAVVISPYLDRATTPAEPRLAVDLSPVTFLDASGLRLLCRAHRRTQAQGGRLALVCRRPALLRVLALTGLESRFAPVPTLAEALSRLAGPGPVPPDPVAPVPSPAPGDGRTAPAPGAPRSGPPGRVP
ncbi:STAS domain-containing protein [Streptomyces zingiberis]|uniref:STAS domain-containing protein n=1 Tax=Streptomyces zingiberis TaxID=2053010 RepID=UPI0028933BDD|nr:STAS domain-containing protein [Streptomyces zingiberis]